MIIHHALSHWDLCCLVIILHPDSLMQEALQSFDENLTVYRALLKINNPQVIIFLFEREINQNASLKQLKCFFVIRYLLLALFFHIRLCWVNEFSRHSIMVEVQIAPVLD